MAGELARLGALIRQLQGALGGNPIIRGNVAGDGTINEGTGFSVTRDSTGSYMITFTLAFSDTPSVAVSAGSSTAAVTAQTGATISASSCAVFTFSGGSVADLPFSFIAIGP